MHGLTHRLPAGGSPGSTVPIRPLGRVVAVADDPATLTLTRQALAIDHRLAVAGNAAEALALLASARPDVVVLGAGLGRFTGARVLAGLAELHGPGVVPVVELDPSCPLTAEDIRARIDAARSATSRSYLVGGLRNRLAA
jgi:DNA-binding NarL/FixJ family response regulator